MAEAMVDEDIDLDSIATQGKVLSLSVSEAIATGFCEAEVESIDDIMLRSGVESYDIETLDLGATERIISIFLNPFVSGILILIIIGGIYFELQTPGVGFPILASLVAIILYFVPNYLNGLAANWEIAVFIIGLILIAVEVFVIPGFGVAGVLGLIFTLSSLVLVMLNNDFFDFSFVGTDQIIISVATVSAGLLVATVLFFVGGSQLADSKFFKRVALQEVQDTSEGFTSKPIADSMVGKKGKSYTVLRPSGKIEINGVIYDAFTRGNYIGENVDVEVVSDEGTSLKGAGSEGLGFS